MPCWNGFVTGFDSLLHLTWCQGGRKASILKINIQTSTLFEHIRYLLRVMDYCVSVIMSYVFGGLPWIKLIWYSVQCAIMLTNIQTMYNHYLFGDILWRYLSRHMHSKSGRNKQNRLHLLAWPMERQLQQAKSRANRNECT